jgi:predicted ATPase
MITQLEIDGFKSFKKFKLVLRPFQVFVGANGVGKSNIFDAIILLSRLAGQNTVYDAFSGIRGGIEEAFTFSTANGHSDTITLAAELLLPKPIRDDLGGEAEVSSTRVRYEVTIKRIRENGRERPVIIYEALTHIIEDDDKWVKTHLTPSQRKEWVIRKRHSDYISTENLEGEKKAQIYLHQDGRSGKRAGGIAQIERTVLSTLTSLEYPTAYAVQKAMRSWQFLQFDPVALRSPSSALAPTILSASGDNLATVIDALTHDDPQRLAQLSNQLGAFVSGLLDIEVKHFPPNRLIIEAVTTTGIRLSSQVLSDGTLRLLALLVLSVAPPQQSLICLEEPENGVHPQRLKKLIEVLKSLVTDFSDHGREVPRQVLLNTHSSLVLPLVKGDLIYITSVSQGGDSHTIAIPVQADDQEKIPEFSQSATYTAYKVKQLLEGDVAQVFFPESKGTPGT